MSKYFPTIGLEIHAELRTKTKMFCDCPNSPDDKQNTNVCPVCLGHPGTLPVINKKAIESMIKIGLAIDGEINENFKFDRKNYFYPDLPKGYQISQFDMPIVKGGNLDVSASLGQEKIVKINRVHLEEDAGKLVHLEGGPSTDSGQQATLVDYNRGGTPLMELVSEPDMHSAEEAVAFAKELQLILRYLGVSDADLERGQMRFDANVSISPDKNLGLNQSKGLVGRTGLSDKPVLGTRAEIKNLNSFGALESAVNYEIQRQTEILEDGGKINQETRGWDDVKKLTVSQRSKEESHDYRYFPEPDLPPLTKDGFDVEKLRLEIPELPNAKRKRFGDQFGLSLEQMSVLIQDREMSNYFEQAVSELESDVPADLPGHSFSEGGSPAKEGKQTEVNADRVKLILNYLTSDVKGLLMVKGIGLNQSKLTAENFADLVDMIFKKEISSRVAKDLIVRMIDTGLDPREIVKNEGLNQISDEGGLEETVKKIISANPKAVEDYKAGKTNALQFLVGKAMAELKGRGNPGVLRTLFDEMLK
ncbi:MAG: Asp-tRNA(Asn)/Glu-tRNA(Gln) amidotransferase subunit GatB [bacterium]|nr:Asp-tRNA(Asn)/Glu-tRNA(Gln) amidotransferase subunit GatB [bacterium]